MIRGQRGALSIWGVVALGLLLCVGLFVPSSALAAPPFLETFGAANEPTFTAAEGMAVDQSTGDLLVIDAGAGTVSRWNPDGTAANFSVLGTNVINGSETPEGSLSFGGPGEVQVAVDNSGGATDGDIYVPQAGAKVVDIFASSGEFIGQLNESSEGVFTEPCGVAVDPSGNLYVGDFSGHIHKYEPAANPPVNGDSSANFAFAENCTLAAGAGPTAGFIFAAHFVGSVAKLDSTSGEEKYEVDAGPTTTVSVDPSSGHVYSATETKIAEFDASGSSSATELPPPISLTELAVGVAVNGSTSNVYATHESGPKVEVFAPGSTADFELKIHKTGAGSGTVTSLAPNTGINCGSECSAEFEEGKEVELEAIATVGSVFAGWTAASGPPGTCIATTSPCKVTMSEAVELEANFAVASPTVTSVTPNEGPTGGGTPVTITGTNFTGATAVKFGTEDAESFSVESATEIKAHSHSGTAGETVDVTVTTGGGTSAAVPADHFTYVAAPTVTNVSPDEGPTAGGTAVTITGTGLTGATKIEYGGAAVNCTGSVSTCKVESATEIKATTAAHSAGTFDVIVTTAGGPSAGTAADHYTYVAAPAVTALSPTKGPTGGGNQVEITGLRLAEATKVEFGSTVVSAPFTENTATTIKLNAPAHAAGTVNVRVTTLGGTSGNFPQDDYTYEVPGTPTLTVVKAGAGSGTVTSSPAGINCGSECAHAYSEGTTVTLTATAAGGSSFAGWSGGACSGTGTCVVTMIAAKEVAATFNTNPPPPPPEEKEGTPKVSPNAAFSGGKVALKFTCKGTGACKGSVTLKAKIKGKNKVIGKSSYSIAAGKSKTIKVTITNGQAKKALREGKTINAKLSGPSLHGTVKLKSSK